MKCRAGFAVFVIVSVLVAGVPATGESASAREDSAFLFSAAGDGSFGSPGTTYRGYSFDWLNPATQTVEAAPAGWTGQDVSEPPGAGDFAALYDHLLNEDPGPANTSFAWAFFDSLTLNPEYGNHPVIPYGPPYAANYVVSPVLEVDQQGRALGSDLIIDDSVSLYLEFWLKRPWPPDSPIQWRFGIAAQVEGQEELGPWKSDFYDFHPEPGWSRFTIHLSELLLDSAEGGNITGVVARLGLVDLAAWYPEQDGPHPPEPFFDNISVWVEEASPAEWQFLERDRFQDNFPEHGGPGDGFVRIDRSGDLNWMDDDLPLSIGDSAVVYCDMRAVGGLDMEFCDPAGEMRPALRMWYRLVDGPHFGVLTESTGDPLDDPQADGSPTDGLCWSPWIGTEEFPFGSGEFWNQVQADSARSGGEDPARHRYAFDLNDKFFQPGDLIEYFFEAFSTEGHQSTLPPYAMSSDPDLREVFILRCLPMGRRYLLVADGPDVLDAWKEGLGYRYTVLPWTEFYVTQASASGLNNGLASRADLIDLSNYEIIIWDSGEVDNATICDANDKTRDDLLLSSWLAEATGVDCTGLWVLGDQVAQDLGMANPFLLGILGSDLVANEESYYDRTGIMVPTVFGTHDLLQFLGGDPSFWVYGGYPQVRHFSLVGPNGNLSEALQEWETDPGDGAVANIINFDPDGNGELYNDQGTPTRAVFNPYSYKHVRDMGYGLIADTDYARAYPFHILNRVFGKEGGPVNDSPETPTSTCLTGSYPNPFNPATTIAYSMAEAGPLSIRVYDVGGRALRTLWDGPQNAGEYELVWDGRDDAGHALASGVYFLHFRAGNVVEDRKLVLLK